MPMEEFLKKVINEKRTTPPEVCQEAFSTNFANAINADWAQKADKYEVVFYKDNIEHIAVFDARGHLEMYKMYLTKDLLPGMIRQELESNFEIMNVVLINQGNHIIYEVIVRDTALCRYLVLVDQLGRIIEERVL